MAFIALLMLLRELSIDVLPILTGAGIAGLAIGFGAQNLVRDVISGFFLILEDQVRVGDAARINGIAGTVEHINLRTIVLRDDEGAVQVFPNGTVTALANLSKQFAYAIVDVRVTYGENIDRSTGRFGGRRGDGARAAWEPLISRRSRSSGSNRWPMAWPPFGSGSRRCLSSSARSPTSCAAACWARSSDGAFGPTPITGRTSSNGNRFADDVV